MRTCRTCGLTAPDDLTAFGAAPCDREPDCGGCDLLSDIWQEGEYDRAKAIVDRYEKPARDPRR